MTARQLRAASRLLSAANALDSARSKLAHARGEFNVSLAAWRIVMRRTRRAQG